MISHCLKWLFKEAVRQITWRQGLSVACYHALPCLDHASDMLRTYLGPTLLFSTAWIAKQVTSLELEAIRAVPSITHQCSGQVVSKCVMLLIFATFIKTKI